MTDEKRNDMNKVTAFKRAQIRHRRRGDDPKRTEDIQELVDFSRSNDKRIKSLKIPDEVSNIYNDDDGVCYSGQIYGLEGFPGFLYAPSALTEPLQFEMAFRSVSTYCEKPHRTNIDLNPPKPTEERNDDEKMWDLWKEENASQKKQPTSKKPKIHAGRKSKYRSFKKLSWATMGYHYDWTERSYNPDFMSNMPEFIVNLAKIFARISMAFEPRENSRLYTPSASIVNYYNHKSNMGGHRDDLEVALDKPIVSFSVGLPAIFLLGGKTKDDEPVVPILVRPGDVMCMGSDTRLNYHAMARLLPAGVAIPEVDRNLLPNDKQRICLEHLDISATEVRPGERESMEEYLSNHRININVRQVYPDNFASTTT